MLHRRQFLALAVSTTALAAPKADITVGITVDTRPDWNGPANFLRSIQEASAVGYHWIETFWEYVRRWESQPAELRDLLAGLNLKLETVSNGAPLRMNFADPAQRSGVIEDHLRLIRFLQAFGCDHLKINCGARQNVSPAERARLYREMAIAFNEIGRRMTDLGMKFGIHAHLGSNVQTREDVDAMMQQTDPRHVYFVLDTGHITMAGMDPVELTRTYVSRIIEYHLKDVAPSNKGGYRGPDLKKYNTGPDDLIFFPLGKGGVDFPAILDILTRNSWRGWFTVELDRTAGTAKEDAASTRRYIESTLRQKV